MGNAQGNDSFDWTGGDQSVSSCYHEEDEQEHWADCSEQNLERQPNTEEQNGFVMCESTSSNDVPNLKDKSDSCSINKQNVQNKATETCGSGGSSGKFVDLSVTAKETEIHDKEKVSSYTNSSTINSKEKVSSCFTNSGTINSKEKVSSCLTDSGTINSRKEVATEKEIPVSLDLPPVDKTLETSSGSIRQTEHVNNVESVGTFSKETDTYSADDSMIVGSSVEKGSEKPGCVIAATDVENKPYSDKRKKSCQESETNVLENEEQKQHQNIVPKLFRILDPDAAAILYINKTRTVEEAVSDFIVAYASYHEKNCVSIQYISSLLQRTDNLTQEVVPPNIYCWIASQREHFSIQKILDTFPEKFTVKDSLLTISELYSKTEALAQLNFLLEEGTFYFFLNKFKRYKRYSIQYCFTVEPVATALKILTENSSVKDAVKMYFKNYHSIFLYDEKEHILSLKRDYFEECSPPLLLSNHIITGYTGKITTVNYISNLGNISFSWKNKSRIAVFVLGCDQVPTDREESLWVVGMIVYFDAHKCEKNSDVWHTSLVWQGHRPQIKKPKTVCWCGRSFPSPKQQTPQNNPADIKYSTADTTSVNSRQDRILGQTGKIIEISSPYSAVAELLAGKQKETVFILSCNGISIYNGTQLLPSKTDLRNYIKEGDEVKFNAVQMTKNSGSRECDWFAKEVFIENRKMKISSPSGAQSKSEKAVTVTDVAGVVTSLIGVTRGIVEFVQDGMIQKALFHRSQLCKDGGRIKGNVEVNSLLSQGDVVVLSAKAYPDMSDQWDWCATEVWLDKLYLSSTDARKSSEKESTLLGENHKLMDSTECPSNAPHTEPSILQSFKNEETLHLSHEYQETVKRAEKEDMKISVLREQTVEGNMKSSVYHSSAFTTKLDASEALESDTVSENQTYAAGAVVTEKSKDDIVVQNDKLVCNENTDSRNSFALDTNLGISQSLENAVTANTSQYQHHATPTNATGRIRDDLVINPQRAVDSMNSNVEIKSIQCIISELRPPYVAIAKLKINGSVEEVFIFVKCFLVNDMPISFHKNLNDYLKVGDVLLINAVPVTEEVSLGSGVNWQATTAKLYNKTEDALICNSQEQTENIALVKNIDSVECCDNKHEERPPTKQQMLSTEEAVHDGEKETLICNKEIQPKMSHSVKSINTVRPLEDTKKEKPVIKQDALNKKESFSVNKENEMKIHNGEKQLQMGSVKKQDVSYSQNKEIVTVLAKEALNNKICTEVIGEIKELRPPFAAVAAGAVNDQMVDIFIFINKISIGNRKLKCGDNVLHFMKNGDCVFMKVKQNGMKHNFKWVAEEAWLKVEPISCPDKEAEHFTNINEKCEAYMQEKAISNQPQRAYSTEDLYVDDASTVSIPSETNSLSGDVLIEAGSVKNMQDKNIIKNCNGRIIKVDATKGVVTFNYKGNTSRAFFYKNKLYLGGKKWNKSLTDNLYVGDIVHMDVRELTEPHFACKYQAVIVWTGKKPQNYSSQKPDSMRNQLESNPMHLKMKQNTSQMTSQEVQKNKQDFTLETLSDSQNMIQQGWIYKLLDDHIYLQNTHKPSVIVSRNCCLLFGISLKDVNLRDIFSEGDVLEFILEDLPQGRIPQASAAWYQGSQVDDEISCRLRNCIHDGKNTGDIILEVKPQKLYISLINFIHERSIDDTVHKVLVRELCESTGTNVASLQEKIDKLQQDKKSSSHEESKVTESSEIIRSDMPVEGEAENNAIPNCTESLPWVVLHPKMYHIMETSMTEVLIKFGSAKAAKFLTKMMKENMKVGMEEMFIKAVLDQFVHSLFESYGNSTAADFLTTQVKDRVVKGVQEWMKTEESDAGTGEKLFQNKACHTVDRECNTEISGTVDGLKAEDQGSEEAVVTSETEKEYHEGGSSSADNKKEHDVERVERESQTISTGSIIMTTIMTDM